MRYLFPILIVVFTILEGMEPQGARRALIQVKGLFPPTRKRGR